MLSRVVVVPLGDATDDAAGKGVVDALLRPASISCRELPLLMAPFVAQFNDARAFHLPFLKPCAMFLEATLSKASQTALHGHVPSWSGGAFERSSPIRMSPTSTRPNPAQSSRVSLSQCNKGANWTVPSSSVPGSRATRSRTRCAFSATCLRSPASRSANSVGSPRPSRRVEQRASASTNQLGDCAISLSRLGIPCLPWSNAQQKANSNRAISCSETPARASSVSSASDPRGDSTRNVSSGTTSPDTRAVKSRLRRPVSSLSH